MEAIRIIAAPRFVARDGSMIYFIPQRGLVKNPV